MKLFKRLNQNGFGHHLLVPIIVILAVAGIGTYVLTHSRAEELSPSIKSTLIVKASGSSTPDKYFKLNSDGNDKVELKNTAFNSMPHSSFNLSSLIGPSSNGVDVYDTKAQTSNQLTNLNSNAPGTTVTDVRLSTDQKQIVYTVNTSEVSNTTDNKPGVYIANADGTGVTLVKADDANGESDLFANPSWQPFSSSRIAYTENSGQYPTLNTTDTSTHKSVSLGYIDSANDYDWSPDNNHIALVHGGDGAIYVSNNDGSNKKTYNVNAAGQISFSPDGKYIVYGGIDISGQANIKVLNLKNGKSTPLAKPTYGLNGLKWLGDSQIVYAAYTSTLNGGSSVIMRLNPSNGTNKTIFQPSDGYTIATLEVQP